MTYHYGMGALTIDEKVGVSKYTIKGDPVIALLAQLNRFAGEQVKAGPTCDARVFVPRPFPLVRSLSFPAANQAWLLFLRILSCAEYEARNHKRVEKVAVVDDVVSWVTSNMAEVTVTIAQLGDSLGLAPAPVGITERDERVTPKFPTTAVLLVGLALGAAYVYKRRKS